MGRPALGLLPIEALEHSHDLADQLLEESERHTHVLFIPHFSDVGRINEMEEEEIVEEIHQEMRDADQDQPDRAPQLKESSQTSTPQQVKK